MIKRPPASFVIRLTGKGVSPELVPLRALSDAASAITRLAIGEIEDGESHSVRVLDVKRGSAVYPCLMESEHETESNLRKVGEDLLKLRITRATFPPTSDYDQMIAEMRELGCDAWDDVEDVDEEIRTMR